MTSDTSSASGARTPALAILILLSTLMPLGLNMYVPAIAAMQADLSTSATTIQLTLSLFLAATAVGQVLAGPLSDIVGRRPVLLVGILLFTAGSLACAFAPTVEVLIVGRVVQALGGSAGLSLARAIVRDVHGTRASASLIGYLTMAMAVAPLVAPVIGGFVLDFASWRVIFDLLAAYGGLVLVAAWLFLFETRRTLAGAYRLKGFFRESGRLLGLPDFWIYAGTLGFLSSSFFAYLAAGPFVATNVYGLTPSAYGLLLTFVVIGYIAGNFVTARFGGRIGISRMIVAGNAVALAGIAVSGALAAWYPAAALGLFAPLLVMGFGNGLALPNCVVGAVSVKPELAGTSAGLAGAFQVGGGALVTFLIGLLLDVGVWGGTIWIMVVPMAAGSALALALGAYTDDRRLAS